MEWEREQQKKNKNKQRAPFRSNPQTHHSVWHDDTSLWPEYSYRTSPASHRCIIHTHTETHKHTSAGSTLLPGIYIATANLTKSSHSYSFTIPPPWHEHIAKIFYGAYSCKRTATKLLWASFTAKVGVRVYPLASHNIDKAVLSGSKPQPSSRNTGRQTGGCMSIWGAYRQIKDAASIPIGRPWWTTRREKGKQTGREGKEWEWVLPSALRAKNLGLSWNLAEGQGGWTQMTRKLLRDQIFFCLKTLTAAERTDNLSKKWEHSETR